MELKNFLAAMEHIETDVCQVIGALKATILKQQRQQKEAPTTDVGRSKQMSAVLNEDEMKKYKGKTITLRPDGRWWARYYDKNKVQHSVYGKTQNECLQKLKNALKEQNETQISKTITLGEWLDKWMTLYKLNQLKPSTLEQMKRYLKDVAPLTKTPLNKLTSIALQEFLNGVTSPRKREKLHLFLKDALTKAVKCKLINDNLFDGIKLPKRIKKKSVALDKEQEEKFVQECKKSNMGDLLLLCLFQGFRLGEALALTYNDLDFNKRTISITKSVDAQGIITTPKTETSIRTVPMFQRTFELLPHEETGSVFTHPRKVYQNEMLKITKRLGLHNVSIHTLRHTFATRCAEIGISAKMTQQWLGHSTLDMTMNVYTHISKDFEQKMTCQIDTYFDTQKS